MKRYECRLLRHMHHDEGGVVVSRQSRVQTPTPIIIMIFVYLLIVFFVIYRQRTQFEIAAADRHVSTNRRRNGVPRVPELHSPRLGRTKRSRRGQQYRENCRLWSS